MEVIFKLLRDKIRLVYRESKRKRKKQKDKRRAIQVRKRWEQEDWGDEKKENEGEKILTEIRSEEVWVNHESFW